MNSTVSVVNIDRVFTCSIRYTYWPGWGGDYMNPPEGPDITLISVRVESITLFDGDVIDRSWLEAHGWADAVDYYIWDDIEWNNEILKQLCEEAECSE